MDGVLVVDKPAGWTSHDVVNKVRRLAATRRVGHLGTLDPMATGVLPLVLNRATRLAQFYTSCDKLYDAFIHVGYSTDTYDADGEPTSPEQPFAAQDMALEPLLNRFRGEIEQVPPAISAKKVGGTAAYKLARRQVPVDLKPVSVTIYSLELLAAEGPEIRIRVHCSAGTYLRSMAQDLGQAFGCGAFLRKLVRLASGDFTLDQAYTLETLAELSAAGRLADVVVPAGRLLPQFPAETVDPVTAGQIRQGRDFRVSPFRIARGTRYVRALSPDGELLAIGEARLPHLYHPMLVF
jgi:tRNA pseudouridine55 synthase